MSTEALIQQYFQRVKEKELLEYEINVLVDNNKKLSYCRSEFNICNDKDIEKEIQENNKKIILKQMKVNELRERNAALEYIIGMLDDESKKILELRYKKRKGFEAMGFDLNMSKSTISRKNAKLVRKISENITASS